MARHSRPIRVHLARVAALVTVIGAFFVGSLTLTATGASAGTTWQNSQVRPASATTAAVTYWGCLNNKTIAEGGISNRPTQKLVGGRFYVTTPPRTPGCSSWATFVQWNQGGPPGQNELISLTTAAPLSADGTVLTHVGGPIKTGVTPITQDVTLPAGTYRVTAYADFSRKAGTGVDNPAGNSTYGTVVVWGDKNGDGLYDWADGEQIAGTAQTGAVPVTPTGSIEQSTSINDIFTLTETTTVRLGGFGYNSNTGSYGTTGQPGAGDFSFLGAHATFEKLNVPS